MFDMIQSEIMLCDGNSTLLLCYQIGRGSNESRDVEKVQKTMNKSKMLNRLKYKDIGQVLKGSIGEANRI